jgi:ribosomal protein S21
MINVQIQKKPSENTSSMLRRFSRGVQEWGGINKLKKIRYSSRVLSSYKKKAKKLKSLKKQAERQELIKLGKISEKTVRGPRRK